MKIGDKVRFLNDVGGGKVSGFRQGGIVMVEDEDGFDVPVHESEVVVIDTNENNFVKKEAPKQKVTFGTEPELKDGVRISGKEYLQQKNREAHTDSHDEVDEQLEARVARLEMAMQRMEAAMKQQEAKMQQIEAAMQQGEEKVQQMKMQLDRMVVDKNMRDMQKASARQAAKQARRTDNLTITDEIL